MDIRKFIRSLQQSPGGQGVFNPWYDSDPENDSDGQGPKIRRQQLAAYLNERMGCGGTLLVGEALGCVVLRRLLDWCHLFADGAGTDEYLRALLENILYDERLHVVHCRARLGAAGVALAAALAPAAAAVVETTWPQIRRLGLDRRAVARGLYEGIEIPADARWVPDDRGRAGL